MRSLTVLFLLFCSSVSFADDCINVIALSKVISTTVEDKSSLDQHAENFCKEFSQSKNSTKSANYSASYKVLSASMGTSGASAEQIASKYCSAADSKKSRTDAYKQYIETISPVLMLRMINVKNVETRSEI